MGEISGRSETRSPVEEGAVRHLQEALGEESTDEKDFHVKHALQLLDVNAASSERR